MYYVPPVATGSLAAVVGSLGLAMHFKATVAGAPATCLMDSCCTNTLMSASYARRVGITVEPSVEERWFLVLKVTLMNLYGLFLVHMLLQ